MDLPNRKQNRLKNYDYSQPNAYFVTICTENRKNMLWENVGASIARPEDVQLSAYGKIVEESIQNIANHYGEITVDNFIIMPNHIHLLLQIHADSNGRAMLAPTISTVIAQMKGVVTKKIGHSIWQKLFQSSPVDDGTGKYALTHYKTIKRANGYSLVELKLETGRKNQIRVHMSDLGHPVLGDSRYGCETDPLGRMALHAFKLCFYHPVTRELMEFETPYPAAFKSIMLRK